MDAHAGRPFCNIGLESLAVPTAESNLHAKRKAFRVVSNAADGFDLGCTFDSPSASFDIQLGIRVSHLHADPALPIRVDRWHDQQNQPPSEIMADNGALIDLPMQAT